MPAAARKGLICTLGAPMSERLDHVDEGELETRADPVVLPARRAKIGPALIILAIVGIVSIGGFVLAALGSGGSKAPTRSNGARPAGGLLPSSAARDLARISSNGNPPADIVAALVVPSAATLRSTANADGGLGLFDRSLDLRADASVAQLVAFYTSELTGHGWKIAAIDSTADGKGRAIYATHPSEDGYYWEVGARIEPLNPSLSPALAGAAVTQAASLVLRLFQVDDAN